MPNTPQDSSPEASAALDVASETPPLEDVESPALQPAVRDRIVSIDVLRGVAVLGILAMNIYAFAMPFMAYEDPLVWGGTDRAGLGVWFFTHIVFDQKFMPIFSMLFGAGLVLMDQRAGSRSMRKVWYRRELWLLLIGAMHGYLLWFGDILFHYAALGMLIYPLRRLQAKKLAIIGSILIVCGSLLATFGGLDQKRTQAKIAVIEAKAPTDLTEEDRKHLEIWKVQQPFAAPTARDVARDMEIYREGSYVEIVKHRAPLTAMLQVMMLLFFGLWRIGGLMLWGMALMKFGVFSATRSDAFYLRMVAFGYGLGLPLVLISAWQLEAHAWENLYLRIIGVHWNYFGSLGVACGHIAIVMLMCKRDWLPALRRRLRAVGQMALSNYLMHSVVLTTVFYGYGLGLYGSLNRPAQMVVVLAMWIAQLLISPWWLERMRFGPAEWLWRCLTYGRLQPLRRTR